MSWFRTILALARPALLPTIWSNCLAGWWLGGGGSPEHLPFLFGGATLLYLGATFLNDAFDAEHDRQHRRARPIPAGGVTHDTVWRWGLGWLVAGTLLMFYIGELPGGIALGLVFLIVLYNTLHRLVIFSPVLNGLCRLGLYALGASVAEHGVTGWTLWCGLALAAFLSGVDFLARWEATPRQARWWPVSLLAAPIFFAAIMDTGRYREPALLLSAVLALWCLKALRQTFWSPEKNLHATVSALLAGIVLVDWLATCPVTSLLAQTNHAPRELSFAFIALFLATLVLQRVIPEG